MIKFLMLVLMTSILTSCASRTEGWFQLGNKVELSKKEVLTLSAKAEKLWKKRGDKASLEEALKIYETLSNYLYHLCELFSSEFVCYHFFKIFIVRIIESQFCFH